MSAMRTLLPLLFLAGCGPDLQPDERILETLPMAEALAEQGLASYSCGNLMFDWTQTVWAYGIHRLYAATGDSRWQGCYRDWMDNALPDFEGEEPARFHSSDSMSPALMAATLMMEDPGSDYRAITDAADLYLSGAPRLSNGAIAHWGHDNPYGFETDQVWIDSMFMFGVYLQRMSAVTDDMAYLDLYADQYEAFAELCRDPAADLYRHAWDDSEQRNIPAGEVYWARGNAWVLVSAAELLNLLADDGGPSETFEGYYRAQAEAFLATQDPEDGLWHTVVNTPEGDDPDNYTETSASALIAYGLLRGAEAGAIDQDAAAGAASAAVAGILDRIEERADGKLSIEGTSFGTNPMEGYEDYVGIEQVDDMMLGYGPAIMLLAEAHGLAIEE
jgi:unsaturated rhamnogalacturonyl hydrolase